MSKSTRLGLHARRIALTALALYAFDVKTVASLPHASPALGVASWGKEPMKVSSTGPENLLPNFFFLSGSEEGGAYSTTGGYHGGTGIPDPFLPPDTCPIEIFENTSPDLRVPVMPYNEQDDWGCERNPENLSVIVLENEYLRAAITPQWGGKIWSLYHKKLNRQLFYNNPAHQPDNIGYRKAWTSGGCEWNWAPGYIGHSVFTESPTWTAILPTEKGDVVRVWEYDRLNHTTWQVDIFLDGEVLWVHPKITNPRPIDLKGYWWTCVAMPVEENGRTRIVTPADLSVTPCTEWPYGPYAETNVSFRGADIDSCRSANSGHGSCAWQQDMSYLGNIPSPHDFFMWKAGQETKWPHRPNQPYIAHVMSDGFTVVHGHPLNGTKFFTWGEYESGAFQQDFMSASDYQNPQCAKDQEVPHYDPNCQHYKHKGKYTELQIGPGRTQMHTFPIPKSTENSGEFQWTEWFKAYNADPSKMHTADYTVPLTSVKEWMDGPQGVSAAEINSMDSFLKTLGSTHVEAHQVVYQGSPWGALYEATTGTKLAPGLYFNFTSNTKGVTPWMELFKTGTFSASTLDAVPTNFEVSPFWLSLLQKSVDAGNRTWLHDLFIGSALLERGDQESATMHLQRSLVAKPSIHAARALAVSAPTIAEARSWYAQAWSIFELSEKSADTVHLGTNLAMEYSIWLTYQQFWDDLRDLFDSEHLTSAMRSKDRVLHARAALELQSGNSELTQEIIRSNCFPTYGSDRQKLIDLWETSYMKQEEIAKGRPLTLTEQVLVRKRLGCVGDGGGSQCHRGPPNIGYKY